MKIKSERDFWAGLMFLVVGIAFASYLTWFWLMTRHSASRLSAFSFLTPVFSTDRKQRFGKGRDEFFALMKAQGVTVATVLGVASDFCVKDMIRGLLAFGFAVEVIEECTAGIARDMAQTVADEFPGRVTLI